MDYSQYFTVLIPVWNAGRYLDIILEYYAGLNIRPTFIFDMKTSDDSESIIRRFDCPVIYAENPTARSQYIVETGARAMKTAWVLRMDDDEIPSRVLLDFIVAAIPTLQPDSIVGFVRHQGAIHGGKIFGSKKHTGQIHRQFRLFQPAYADFTRQGHSPGYVVPEAQRVIAPDSAAMLHLDWIVHSPQERKDKIEKYDAHTPNHGSAFREYYLADVLDKDFSSQLVPIEFEGIEQLSEKLNDRFGQTDGRQALRQNGLLHRAKNLIDRTWKQRTNRTALLP